MGKHAFKDGDGTRALEAARTATAPLRRYGYYVARARSKHGDAALAADAEALHKATKPASEPEAEDGPTDGASIWFDEGDVRNVRVVVGGKNVVVDPAL